jgi:hypothetical protein
MFTIRLSTQFKSISKTRLVQLRVAKAHMFVCAITFVACPRAKAKIKRVLFSAKGFKTELT